MREFCLDEGTLQSFFDGELSPARMEQVASHLSACADCAGDASELEQESAMLAAAFEPELSLNVPTERLRARLDAAITDLQPQQQFTDARQGSRLRALLAGFASLFNVAPQYATGFASIVAVIAFAALFSFVFLRHKQANVPADSTKEIAQASRQDAVQATSQTSPAIDVTTAGSVASQPDSPSVATPNKGNVNAYTPVKHRLNNRKIDNSTGSSIDANRENVAEAAHVKLLPGEKNYLKAIDSLTTAINQSGEDAMKPTLRAEYQRNLEIVDRAIAASRLMAQKNPNDPDAQDLLLTAYQSKVDLLNVVADQQARLSPIER